MDKLELERIALRLRGGEQRIGFLAVAGGLDVASGGEHDRIESIERGIDRLGELRQAQRSSTRGEQRSALPCSAAVIAEVVQAGGDADQGSVRITQHHCVLRILLRQAAKLEAQSARRIEKRRADLAHSRAREPAGRPLHSDDRGEDVAAGNTGAATAWSSGRAPRRLRPAAAA